MVLLKSLLRMGLLESGGSGVQHTSDFQRVRCEGFQRLPLAFFGSYNSSAVIGAPERLRAGWLILLRLQPVDMIRQRQNQRRSLQLLLEEPASASLGIQVCK